MLEGSKCTVVERGLFRGKVPIVGVVRLDLLLSSNILLLSYFQYGFQPQRSLTFLFAFFSPSATLPYPRPLSFPSSLPFILTLSAFEQL